MSWLTMGPRLIGLAVLALTVFFAWTNVQSVITRYTNMSGEIATLRREKNLLSSRLVSYNLRIARRDEAIAASKCADTIKRWVSHPDEIPKPFNPFDQLK